MAIEYRTLLIVEQNRHDVRQSFVPCVYDADADEIHILPGLATDPAILDEQLRAFRKVPIGFMIPATGARVSDGAIIHSCGEMGGIAIDGHVTLNDPEIFQFRDYGPTGGYKRTWSGNSRGLTTGACLRINDIFEKNMWRIHFTDDFILRNRTALKEDGSVQGVR